jgi:DNA-binding response OmpR family regulator
MKQKLILHIEDDNDQREVLERKISPRYAYRGVESAEEAEKLLPEKSLSLIVLDLALPLMNGFEFLKKNRRQLSERGILVIITTGLEGAGIEDLVKEHHCAAYYRKPIPIKEFLGKIRELVG